MIHLNMNAWSTHFYYVPQRSPLNVYFRSILGYASCLISLQLIDVLTNRLLMVCSSWALNCQPMTCTRCIHRLVFNCHSKWVVYIFNFLTDIWNILNWGYNSVQSRMLHRRFTPDGVRIHGMDQHVKANGLQIEMIDQPVAFKWLCTK